MRNRRFKYFGFLVALIMVFNSCFKDDLLKEINDLKTQVNDMQKLNDALNGILNARADSLSQALSTAQKRSDSLSNVLRTKSDSLALALGLTNSNLANISRSVDSIKTQIATISGQLTQLNLQLTSITTQLSQLNQQMGALSADVSRLAGKYAALNASLQTINTQIATLQAEQLKQLEKLNAILLQLNPPMDVTTGLVAYYPFNGTAGDSSGNGNHGTVIGAIPATDRFGISNKSYFFEGSSSYITIPSSISNSNIKGAATFSSWLNSNNGNNYFICKSNSTDGDYRIFTTSSYLRFVLDSKEYSLNYNFPINQWFHIVVTFFNGTVNLFMNGNLVGTTSVVFNNYPVTNTNTNLEIGRDPWGLNEFHQGKIDEIRVYNRALTQSEITYLANN
jgi:archaellum component FlaC